MNAINLRSNMSGAILVNKKISLLNPPIHLNNDSLTQITMHLDDKGFSEVKEEPHYRYQPFPRANLDVQIQVDGHTISRDSFDKHKIYTTMN